MSVKVSIILTAFNCENTIEEAVRALLVQTYTNLELIIVDDASTDYTLTILKGLQRQDERIRLITTSVNYGTYVCKNYGMKIATGDYFMFHDSDDQCTPLYVETSISFLVNNPQVKVCYQNCFIDQSRLKNLRTEWTQPHWYGLNSISSSFSRAVFEEVGYFDSVRFGADSELMVRWMCVYGDGVVLLPEETPYHLIKREGSLTCDEQTSIRSRSRIEYENKCYFFHKRIMDKNVDAYMGFPQTKRPFEIDNIISIGKEVDLSTFKEIKKGPLRYTPLTTWLQHNPKWKDLSSPVGEDIDSHPNLVFTSAGDDTNFDELWLDKNRKYDVWVTYYGDDDELYEKYKSKVDYIEKRKGSKFQNFHHIYTTKNLSKYKRFFILDDDIIISTEEINKMFKISEEASLWICQPSFDHKSKLGWIINKHRKEYYLRYTNFVEVNTPLFTKGALSKLMDHYSPELVEFGVDYLYIWANGLEERKKYAIIDSVQCHNPYNTEGGDKLSQQGMSLEDRVKVWEHYRKELNIPQWEHKIHQYVPTTKMQIEMTKADFSHIVDVKFNEKLSIPSSTEDKIALLFLTRNNLKHPQLWYDFINDAQGKCNIYAHTKEKDLITQDFLKEAQIPTHIDTKWGDYSLVKAVNELIRAAVKDPTNKFFIVLCESAIPIHKFGPIYQFLFKNQKSILYTKLTPLDKDKLQLVCNQIMNPAVLNLNKNNIIRNSQWMIITREHAEIIATTNHEEEFKNFPIADEWYHYNVLQYYDKDFSTKVLNFKPIYFQYDVNDIEDPLPHPIEVTDKELIRDVKENYYSLFFRKVSPDVTLEYQEL